MIAFIVHKKEKKYFSVYKVKKNNNIQIEQFIIMQTIFNKLTIYIQNSQVL